MLVLNAYQIVMATQQDISARHCVIIQLPCCDEEPILKYLYEHCACLQLDFKRRQGNRNGTAVRLVEGNRV